MKRFILFQLIIISLFFSANKTTAVPAYPYPYTISQPDGSKLTIILKGDEFFHYYTTEDGYLIKKNEKGFFDYAKLDENGNTISTSVRANDENKRSNSEKKFVKQLPSNPSFSKQNVQSRIKKAPNAVSSIPPSAPFPKKGSPRSLVILVNFADINFVTPNPNEAFNSLLNELGYSTNGGTGSARDYFRDNSMGTFDPNFDVVGPFTLPQPVKYYGENDASGNDKNPVQMIVDACRAAYNSGVDFSLYDTDQDNVVDNVFVYYAGHNEAEHAPSDRVWPHRWGIYPTEIFRSGNYTGSAASVTFNGKRVEDYACTSELRGSSGANMAGIGTFTHEFGHVLGLADMYATNDATHFTLSRWDIMDDGAYLNNGRTPPSYNSFERFQLGFLKPQLLTAPTDAVLKPLNTHNEAYLISSTDFHNLDGSNPQPTEFFLLENRQRTGWDAYLPGNGMMIYRINYNQNDWDYNIPNNDPTRMGVQIMPADKIGSTNTMAGDPYPGTSKVLQFIPMLRNGTQLTDKRISFIEETNKIITFRYNDGKTAPVLSASGTISSFQTVQGTPSAPQSIIVSGRRLINNISLSFTDSEHFEIKKESDPETAWSKSLLLAPVDSILDTLSIQVRYNPTVPSYTLSHGSTLLIESELAESIRYMLTGKSSRPVYVVAPVAYDAKDITSESFVASWSPVFDATGYYLTVEESSTGRNSNIIINKKWVTSTSDTIYNLVSDRDYYYHVTASDKNTMYGYENITPSSNTVNVKTLPFTEPKGLRAVVRPDATVTVFVTSENIGKEHVNVFNSLGQKIDSKFADNDRIDFYNLPKNVVLIIQTGKNRTKVIIR